MSAFAMPRRRRGVAWAVLGACFALQLDPTFISPRLLRPCWTAERNVSLSKSIRVRSRRALSDDSSMTVAELAETLRGKGLQTDGRTDVKAGNMLADLIEHLATNQQPNKEGDILFSELLALNGEASKDDYFDAASGAWDLDGLKDDLSLVSSAVGDTLFSELLALNGEASKDDYFDAASGAWDLDGLKDDLSLVSSAVGDTLFSELLALNGEASKDDYFDAASGAWDLDGLKDDLSLVSSAVGDTLFSELLALNGKASKDDYFDAASGAWDLDGLKDDLSLVSSAQAAHLAQPVESVGDTLFSELLALNGEASKDDYFDAASGAWDLDGLKDDLSLVSSAVGDTLFSELLALNGEASKDDYFDAASGAWDLDGLKDDLSLVSSAVGDTLFSELLALNGEASKDDYFDAASGAWDLDGLKDDLSLVSSAVGDTLFSELLALNGEASKDDYFDAASGAWDLDGLKDDLSLVSSAVGDTLFSELLALNGEASKDDYFDAASGAWDLDGLKDDLSLVSSAVGDTLFSELLALDGEASKDDYFDAASGAWDLDGLKDDLSLAKASSSVQAAHLAQPVESVGDTLFSELLALDGEASKDDYFDAASGAWDLDGLKDDLSLAKASSGAQAAHLAQPVESVGDTLFSELLALDGKASKDDYFDAASGAWDLDGLKDDLSLAKASFAPQVQSPSRGEELFAELKRLDALVSKEDYLSFGAWDLEGLEDDLQLARASVGPQEDGSGLLAELRVFDDSLSKEDYFNAKTGVWDIEGLRDDLGLAKARAREKLERLEAAHANGASDQVYTVNAAFLFQRLKDLSPKALQEDYMVDGSWDLDALKVDFELVSRTSPEELLRELQKFSPGAVKEDYFDEATLEWDMEGLQEDLQLSRDPMEMR